jgi:hypothetical protein
MRDEYWTPPLLIARSGRLKTEFQETAIHVAVAAATTTGTHAHGDRCESSPARCAVAPNQPIRRVASVTPLVVGQHSTCELPAGLAASPLF